MSPPPLPPHQPPAKRRRRRCDKRSRNGCLTCKKRRVKCDEHRPKCTNCLRLNLPCSYGLVLLWEDEALAKGISFGRSKLNKIISQQSRRPYLFPNEQRQQTLTQAICSDASVVWGGSWAPFPLFVNAHAGDFDKIYATDAAGGAATAPEPIAGALRALAPAPAVVALADEQNWLFNHFSHTMVPRMVIAVVDNHPWRAIIQLALQLTLLFTAIVAVAASDVAGAGAGSAVTTSAKRRHYGAVAATLHAQTLRMLPHTIKQYEDLLAPPHQWDDVLATMVVLAIGDMAQGKGALWLVHVTGARNLLRHTALTATPTVVARFFIEFFVNHEVASIGAWESLRRSRNDPGFLDDNHQMLSDLWRHLGGTALVVFGTLARLLMLIHHTTRLGHQYETMVERSLSHEADRAWMINERNGIEAQLVQLYQPRLPPGIDPVAGDVAAHTVTRVFEAKRLAAIVYLFARVDVEYLNLRHPGTSGGLGSGASGSTIMALLVNLGLPLESPKLYADKFRQIKQISAAVLDIVAQIVEPTSALIWPLFVIGVVLADSDDLRWGVLCQLNRINHHRSLAQVKRAIDVLERVWNERDLEAGLGRWLEVILGKGPPLSLT